MILLTVRISKLSPVCVLNLGKFFSSIYNSSEISLFAFLTALAIGSSLNNSDNCLFLTVSLNSVALNKTSFLNKFKSLSCFAGSTANLLFLKAARPCLNDVSINSIKPFFNSASVTGSFLIISDFKSTKDCFIFFAYSSTSLPTTFLSNAANMSFVASFSKYL